MNNYEAKRNIPAQKRSRARIAGIKEQAIAMFDNCDLTDISMSTLADMCGVKRTSLYRYYASIEAVAADLFNDRVLRIKEEMLQSANTATVVYTLGVIGMHMDDLPMMVKATVKQSLEQYDSSILAMHVRPAYAVDVDKWKLVVDLAVMHGSSVAKVYAEAIKLPNVSQY